MILDVKYVFCVFRNDLETQCILCILMTQDVVPLCILLCVFWKGMETLCILCIWRPGVVYLTSRDLYQPAVRRSPASPARRLVSAGHGRRRSSIATHPFSSSHLGARFRVQKHSELLSSVLYAPPTFSDPLAHVLRFAYLQLCVGFDVNCRR